MAPASVGLGKGAERRSRDPGTGEVERRRGASRKKGKLGTSLGLPVLPQGHPTPWGGSLPSRVPTLYPSLGVWIAQAQSPGWTLSPKDWQQHRGLDLSLLPGALS